MEIWKDVVGYENKYEVSSLGRVRSLLDCRGNVQEPKILKTFPNNRDYYMVGLCKDGIPKTFLVHRLVGLAFLENPENKPTIDHIIRTRKFDNSISNLRWATIEEQVENKEQPIVLTNSRVGKSGEKYIHYMPKLDKWRVYNKRHNPVLEYFDTLQGAIIFRNEYLKTLTEH